MSSLFRHLPGAMRNANVGCLGAILLTAFAAALIFGLVLMAWWPYLGLR